MTAKQIYLFASLLFIAFLLSCSSPNTDNKGDKTAPVFINVNFSDAVAAGEVSGSIEISWTTEEENPASMQIALINSADSQFEKIIASVDNSNNAGSYLWNSTLNADGQRYRLRLRATDRPNNRSDNLSPEFAINNNSNGTSGLNFSISIQNQTRSTGISFVTGVSEISWSGNGLINGSLTIELSTNSGSTWVTITSYPTLTSNTGTYGTALA